MSTRTARQIRRDRVFKVANQARRAKESSRPPRINASDKAREIVRALLHTRREPYAGCVTSQGTLLVSNGYNDGFVL